MWNTVYIYRDREYEKSLGKALKDGCNRLKDNFNMILLPNTVEEFEQKVKPYDVVIFFGCAGLIPHCYRKAKELNKNTIYIDKGYDRAKDKSTGLITEYCRVSVNEFQPLSFIKKFNCDEERFLKLHVSVRKTKDDGKHIIFAGGSQKYCDFHQLGDANLYAENIIKELKKYTDRPIYYRPKPSFKGGKPIPGSYFSPNTETLEKLLKNCYTLITFGSNACLEASYFGVPTMVLGDGITHSISNHKLEEINSPVIPEMKDKMKVYRNMAYCQWKSEEMKSGQMWAFIRRQFISNSQYDI